MKKLTILTSLLLMLVTMGQAQITKEKWELKLNDSETLELNNEVKKFAKTALIELSINIADEDIFTSDIIIVNKEDKRFIKGYKQANKKDIKQEIDLNDVWNNCRGDQVTEGNVFEIQYIYITGSGKKNVFIISDFIFE